MSLYFSHTPTLPNQLTTYPSLKYTFKGKEEHDIYVVGSPSSASFHESAGTYLAASCTEGPTYSNHTRKTMSLALRRTSFLLDYIDTIDLLVD